MARRAGRSGCQTGKRRFADRLSALIALADISTSDRAQRQEIRTYACPRCHGWHLTSKAPYEKPALNSWEPGRKRSYQPPRLEKG